jgi:ArsR family metal-binding transcriptional regulator
LNLRINHIQHIGIPVTDIKRSEVFYENLGFQNVMQATFEHNREKGKVSMMKLDEDMSEAMKKMKKVHDLILFLPQIDCGTCGSPSCSALAEDIVQGRASLAQCHFVQRTLEDRKLFTREESVKTLEDTWSSDKFNRRWLLNL